MTGQALQERVVVHPATGEVLELTRPTPELAEFLDGIREMESRAKEAKGMLTRELLGRLDSRAEWTLREDGWEVSGDGPGRVEYDGAELLHTLRELVVAGDLEAEAAQKAVEAQTVIKPRKAGVNALMKLGGKVAEALKEIERPVPEARRRVKVSRT